MRYNIKTRGKILTLFAFLVLFGLLMGVVTPYRTQLLNNPSFSEDEPKISAYWGEIELTNVIINNTYLSTGDTLVVNGRLTQIYPFQGIDNLEVRLRIDNQVYPTVNNKTAGGGYFSLDTFIIPGNMNIYSSHLVDVVVVTPNTVDSEFYIININTTSYFDNVVVDNTMSYLQGESFSVAADLLLENTTGVPSVSINADWVDSSETIVGSTMITCDDVGHISTNVVIPNAVDDLKLRLSYAGSPEVGYSEINCSTIEVFQNISLRYPSTTNGTAGLNYIVTGQLVSAGSGFSISNRIITIAYNGSIFTQTQTAPDGWFSCSFRLPSTNGTASYQVILNSSVGDLYSLPVAIYVNPALTGGGSPATEIPFAEFFMVFIPIVVVIVAALLGYGYYFLKKQKESAQVTKIPLEGKISNLKILKDSGRLEEALSYLFNAIYMTLVEGKYGRTKKEFETIRDYAIVSVKEFRMKPTVIYPFMTKVEEIIYSRPFKMSEKDFYNAIELFSSVYFELTGYNFVLNF